MESNMDFQKIVDGINVMACIVSVENLGNGKAGKYRTGLRLFQRLFFQQYLQAHHGHDAEDVGRYQQVAAPTGRGRK